MIKYPYISVIMSAYNEDEIYIKKAIESILEQTYRNFEFIIILDNPQNELLKDVIRKYEMKDKRIIFVINEKNVGLAKSLNRGLSIARGKYIARMDADDISLPSRLEKEKKYLDNHPDCVLVAGTRVDIDEKDNIIASNNKYFDDNAICKMLPHGSPITHPTIMFQKEAIEKLGNYRSFDNAQDYDLYLRCLSNQLKMNMIPDCVLKYRIRGSGISISNPYKQYVFCSYARILYIERMKHHNRIDSFSEKNIQAYKDKMKLNNKFLVSDFNNRFKLYNLCIKNKNILQLFYLLFSSRWLSRIFINSVVYKFYQNKYSKSDMEN